MAEIERIQNYNREVERLAKKISGGFSFWKNSNKKRLLEIKGERDDLLHEHLFECNSNYQELIEEQLSLLSGSVLEFTAYKSNYSMTTSYSYRFAGNIKSNGHAFLEVSETSWAAGMLYSTKFEGGMDSFGNIEMVSSKLGGAVWKTFPSKYEGQIYDNGHFAIEAVKTEWDVIVDRYVARMVAKVFSEERKTRKYFSNLDLLNKIATEELKKLLTTTGHTL